MSAAPLTHPAPIRKLDGKTVAELIERDGPFSPEQVATLHQMAATPMKASPPPIHPVFRWVRTSGYRADPAVEERLPDGRVRVEQWIWTPDIGWDRHVETVDPVAFVRWELGASCRELDAWASNASTEEIEAALQAEVKP